MGFIDIWTSSCVLSTFLPYFIMTQLNYTYILNLLRNAHLMQLLIVTDLVWPNSQIDRGVGGWVSMDNR